MKKFDMDDVFIKTEGGNFLFQEPIASNSDAIKYVSGIIPKFQLLAHVDMNEYVVKCKVIKEFIVELSEQGKYKMCAFKENAIVEAVDLENHWELHRYGHVAIIPSEFLELTDQNEPTSSVTNTTRDIIKLPNMFYLHWFSKSFDGSERKKKFESIEELIDWEPEDFHKWADALSENIYESAKKLLTKP